MTKKPMTVEDIARETWLEVKSCIEAPEKMSIEFGDYHEDGCIEAVKQALLTFAAQKVEEATEPLIKAHEKIVGWKIGELVDAQSVSEDAIIAHSAKYPRKP